jgi:hypothetical protein
MASSGNRYAALQDTALDESKDVQNTQDGSNTVTMEGAEDLDHGGWEEKINFEPGADEDSDTDRQEEDTDRRRKVSQGQAGSVNTVVRHGAGRGGGLLLTSVHRNGLATIEEGATLEAIASGAKDRGNAIAVAFQEEASVPDLSGLLNDTVPPEPAPIEKQTTMFTFRAQLTWGLEKGPEVNLPELFREWVKNTSKYIPDFALLPFEDVKGQVISTPEQVPYDNPNFYKEYYHNHRVLQHGNLTGMVQFQCSISWQKIKRMKEPYFQWLHQSKVYLNLTKFKSDTLVVCGFLLGAHPGHLRREDAEKELLQRLTLDTDFPFQLSSRTISVPFDNSKDAKRYSFPAVAVETSSRQAKHLREAFFSQPKPEVAKVKYPYTGLYQFVPMLQSKEWPTVKIFQLAKVHVKILFARY